MTDNNEKLLESAQRSLLPCPFCGSKPKISIVPVSETGPQQHYDFIDIQCMNNDCPADVTADTYDDRFKSEISRQISDAVKKWNTRV